MKTAEFEIKDILIALKVLTDNEITKVEIQFDVDGSLVMQGQEKHIIRPRVAPIKIHHNRDIRGSLVEEKREEIKNNLGWKSKIIALLGDSNGFI